MKIGYQKPKREPYGGIQDAMKNFFFQGDNSRLVVGIGSVLVDIIVPASEEFVGRAGVPKGGMVYFDADTIQQVLHRADGKAQVVPGGAACNTILGVACLGGETRFLGKRGQDEFGHLFEKDLGRHRVDPFLIKAPTPTGRVLSLITPDSQRTMLTYLGAAAEMTPSEIPVNAFEGAAIALIEGYLVYNRDLFLFALDQARAAGAKIVLDLASFTVVEENREFTKPSFKNMSISLLPMKMRPPLLPVARKSRRPWMRWRTWRI